MTRKKLRIMLIDDEESIREAFTWFLEFLGHEVVSSAAPFDCDVYRGHSCNRDVTCTDVLLIDHHLPGMKGLEFIEALKERGCKGITRNMLIMSGDSTSIDPKKAEELGVTVVQKPMGLDFLEAWLSQVESD